MPLLWIHACPDKSSTAYLIYLVARFLWIFLDTKVTATKTILQSNPLVNKSLMLVIHEKIFDKIFDKIFGKIFHEKFSGWPNFQASFHAILRTIFDKTNKNIMLYTMRFFVRFFPRLWSYDAHVITWPTYSSRFLSGSATKNLTKIWSDFKKFAASNKLFSWDFW